MAVTIRLGGATLTMVRIIIVVIGMITAVLNMMGCSNLLPTVEQTTESKWKNYEETKQSFDKITPGKTTSGELKELGFDPFVNPNIKLLNYLDITRIFIPNESIRMADLHPDIRICLKAKIACRGYEISPKITHSERYGNVVLDIFNFRRKTRTTGWRFQGLIILNGELVVYKLESGEPKILELEDRENPLGPLQDISVNPGLSLD
jgi:hypothetical protein